MTNRVLKIGRRSSGKIRLGRTRWSFSLLGFLISVVLSFGVFDVSLATRSDAKGFAPLAPAVFNGRIAFASTRDSEAFDIYTINPNGSFPLRLTDDESGSNEFQTYDFDPAWSPDGSKLAFVSNREGGSFEIFTMNADGSNVQRLTDNAIEEGQPKWSPDGTKIAFTRGGGCAILTTRKFVPSDDSPCVPYIYVMNADGTNQVKVSQGENEAWPVWSPDGTKLAFGTVNWMAAEAMRFG